MSLGQCLKHKYRLAAQFQDTAIICWLVASSIFLGNLLFEANNFAGGVDAVMAMPGARDLDQGGLMGQWSPGEAYVLMMMCNEGLRIGSCVLYAVAALILLVWDKTDKLGIMLGLLMMGMVSLFLIVVACMGLDWTK